MTIRIMVADDHAAIVHGLSVVFCDQGIEVVGAAHEIADVIPTYEKLRPDALVLDIRFGCGPTGLDLARDLIKLHPDAKLVFYSQFDQAQIVREAYKLGAKAFAFKSGSTADLVAAIKTVVLGKLHFTPEVMQKLAELTIGRDVDPRERLSERELKVFILAAQGMTHVEIAKEMGLSVRTIGNVFVTIKDQLGVERPADITLMALRHMLITL